MSNNFGKLNAIFVKNIASVVNGDKNGKLIKEYVNMLKKNKALMSECALFENLENASLNSNARVNVNEYINEAISCLDCFDKKELKSLNEKLEKILISNGISIDDHCLKNKELYESIDYLIFNKPTVKNLNNRVIAKNIITEHITKNNQVIEEQTKEVPKNPDMLYKIMINNFNKKYNDELNEEDRKIFKTITSKHNDIEKKEIFEQYKNECIQLTETMLNENIGEEAKLRLEKVKDTLNEQFYDKNTYIEDVLKLIKLKDSFLD